MASTTYHHRVPRCCCSPSPASSRSAAITTLTLPSPTITTTNNNSEHQHEHEPESDQLHHRHSRRGELRADTGQRRRRRHACRGIPPRPRRCRFRPARKPSRPASRKPMRCCWRTPARTRSARRRGPLWTSRWRRCARPTCAGAISGRAAFCTNPSRDVIAYKATATDVGIWGVDIIGSHCRDATGGVDVHVERHRYDAAGKWCYPRQ